MTQQLFVGVDGGATKVLVRIEDEDGTLLSQGQGGAANIRVSVPTAWDSINETLTTILKPLGISLPTTQYQIHVGMGLAGCEIAHAYEAFLKYPHPFNTLIVSSDAHTACLGAHDGLDGAIIVIGTGSVGFQLQDKQITKVGGWGFPHDDEGGGASIGLDALKLTLKWLDKRVPESPLTKAIYAYFNEDFHRLITWANAANSKDLAELAPIVIQCANINDESAQFLLRKSARAISQIALALSNQSEVNPLPLSLVGGLAPSIQPYLHESLRKQILPCKKTPDAGAILLVRHHLSSRNK